MVELPSDDEGLDLGGAPFLPDKGRELPGLPDDDLLDDMFGDHLANPDWLERSLVDIVEDFNDLPSSQVCLLITSLGWTFARCAMQCPCLTV